MDSKKLLQIIWSLFLLFYLPSLMANTNLLRFNMSEQPDNVVLKFAFDDAIKYHCLVLSKPDRFVIDFDNTNLKTKLKHNSNSLVANLRSNDHDHQYLRIVFDLKHKVEYQVQLNEATNVLIIQLLKPNANKEKKVFIAKDDLDHIEQSIDRATKEPTPLKLSAQLPLHPAKIDIARPRPAKNIVIVIDPGHGGKDPGARGMNGTCEKNVVLQISKQLQSMLNEEPGFCAVLTRSTDYYIPLRKRLSIARKNHADMFIAIHADAYHHSHATGASVYALSPRGATSEAARWLAEKENESELGGLGTELADKDAVLRSVLIDLSQTHTIESSLQIGNTVLQHLSKFARLHHPRVEQAAFVVLKSPDIPSILVETGFLSNPGEEYKLMNPQYQQRTAFAIKEGIKRYFEINAPGETWFSQNHETQAKIAINGKHRSQY